MNTLLHFFKIQTESFFPILLSLFLFFIIVRSVRIHNKQMKALFFLLLDNLLIGLFEHEKERCICFHLVPVLSEKLNFNESIKRKATKKVFVCVVCCPSYATQHVHIVMKDCSFQGAHCMEFNKWLISPCTRGMTVGRLSVCFSSPSLFTGNFHVVNGGIDSGSILFVLSSVYHLRRKQEWELS